ncbi:MAG: efflux RND transporter periplasmic adaptor subunit [Magnetococcales bacterium]|nr:efflux RND transporter periplasmic adaptor subunit [Magnetococcales bacterium]
MVLIIRLITTLKHYSGLSFGRILITVTAAVCAIIIPMLSACSGAPESGSAATGTKPAVAAAEVVTVEAAPVSHRAAGDSVRAMGHFEACTTVAVKSRLEGAIIAAHVHDGAEVAAGALLFELDDRLASWQRQQRRGEHNRDQAQLALARLRERRQQELKRHDVASSESLEQARANRELAEAAATASEAALHQAELLLGFTRIHAPIAGRVGRVLLHPGNLVKAYDDTPLLVIHQVDPLCIRYALLGRDLPRLAQRGALPIKVRLPEGKEPMASGRVDNIDSTIDPATGTFLVTALVANSDRVLRPGLHAEVETILDEWPDVAVVPVQALMTRVGGERMLYLLSADQRVTMRVLKPSELLAENGSEALLAGSVLPAGAQVVVTGQWRLSDGAKVRLAAQ